MDGITLDSGRQKIYYTDARADGQVCEVSMDGTNQRVITWSVNSQPRAILVDTSQKLVEWIPLLWNWKAILWFRFA